MRRNHFSYLLLFMIFAFFYCSPSKIERTFSNEEKLIKEINYLLSDPSLANAEIGLYIESLSDNRTVFRQNEYKLFVPASNQKLYTTAAALENLGSDFHFKTEFYSHGKIENNILNGDLIVRGMGDPSISGRFKNDDVLAYFSDWADSLKSKGITKISGKLIGNDSYFSGSKLGYGWNWVTTDVADPYTVGTGMMSLSGIRHK